MLHPVRLPPRLDLRRALEQLGQPVSNAFVVAGIGSLHDVHLRLAAAPQAIVLPGPHEILTLSGSLCRDGGHLHISVADAHGRVMGGHLGYGSIIRTTAEILLIGLTGWELSREHDPATGYPELVIRVGNPRW